MAATPGLHDTFSEEGLWWKEGYEDDQVGGTLTYGPDNGPELKLLGVLGDLVVAINQSFGAEGDDFTTIHGVTAKGKPVTLLRAFNTNRQINTPGLARETWKANLLVVGLHISSADDDALFSKSYVRFEAIEPWLGHNPFSRSLDSEDKTLTIVARKPREEPFASLPDFELATVGSLYSYNDPKTRFTIDVISQIVIMSSESRSLNWHVGRAVRVQELASLCTGHFLPLTSLELRGPDVRLGGGGTMPAEVHLYARMIHQEAGKRPTHEPPLITCPELTQFSPTAVQLWFNQYELFAPAIGLFFTISGQRQMFTNARLLLAIQALEVFHRRTTTDSIMPPEEFPALAKSLVDAIPSDAGRRMRDKLEGLYRFANEPSLNQRLKAIVAELTAAFGQAPAGFDGPFLRKLVDTRNYYTHFSAELEDRILDGEGMYWAARRVVLLLTLLFLQRLGVAGSDIAPLLERHREFAQLWASDEYPRW